MGNSLGEAAEDDSSAYLHDYYGFLGDYATMVADNALRSESDVGRAIEFYVDRLGFHLDIQARVDENTRFVQVTPPTSACSIAFGEGITAMTLGMQHSIHVVVPDAEAARRELVERGVEAPEG